MAIVSDKEEITASICDDIKEEDSHNINQEVIDVKINNNTLSVLLKFYHDISCSGKLMIQLYKKVLLSHEYSTLNLIMDKTLSSYKPTYDFYLEFTNAYTEYRNYPLKKHMYFDGFSKEYNKSFDIEDMRNLILNSLNKTIMDLFSDQYFRCKINLQCFSPMPIKEEDVYSIKEDIK